MPCRSRRTTGDNIVTVPFGSFHKLNVPPVLHVGQIKGVLGTANQLLLFYIFQMKASSGDMKIKKEKENGFSR